MFESSQKSRFFIKIHCFWPFFGHLHWIEPDLFTEKCDFAMNRARLIYRNIDIFVWLEPCFFSKKMLGCSVNTFNLWFSLYKGEVHLLHDCHGSFSSFSGCGAVLFWQFSVRFWCEQFRPPFFDLFWRFCPNFQKYLDLFCGARARLK